MSAVWQDLKYAVRGLRRRPGFTAATVFALALGIGSNTVIFSAFNAILLNPPSFRQLKDPSRLTMIWEKNATLMAIFANHMPVRLRNYRAWKERAQSFEDLALWEHTSLTLTSSEDRAGLQPEQVEAGIASPNFFPLLGIGVRMGRNFTAEDRQAAILTDALYRSRFHGDPRILERTLLANGKQYRIVGVLPPGFQLPAMWEGSDQKNPQIWIPANLRPDRDQDEHFGYFVFGRLRPGVAVEQARSEMNAIAKRLAEEFANNAGFGVNVYSIVEENVSPQIRRALVVLQVAVGFVLLIACANAGSLLLTLAVARGKEIATRSALGASRIRIVRQLVTESSILSLLGAAGGLLLSFWSLPVLRALAPGEISGLKEVQMDAPVLLFTVGVALAAGLLFGLAPASHALKQNMNDILTRTARSVAGSSPRLRNLMVAVEIALSVVLLIGAGLMIRTLGRLMSTDLGFRPDHLLVMRITLPESKYGKPPQIASFNRRLLENIRHLAGVQGAALTNALPMKSVNQSSFEIPGRSYPAGTFPVANWGRTSDGYFETLDLRLVRGRTFTLSDLNTNDPNVAVVNQAFIRMHFPDEDPLGRPIAFSNEAGKQTEYKIVGVVANERQMGPDSEQSPQFYLPGNRLQSMILVVRTVADPLSMAPAVKEQVWNIDKDQPVSDVVTAEAALREFTASPRFSMVLLMSFAGIAVVLATVGLYSALAYSATLRTREIGIRMALGAGPRMVAALILKQGLRMALIGIAAGLAGAFTLTRFMTSLIFGVNANDPLTFLSVSALLVAISVLASYLPAARAARVDPIEALRVE